MIKKTSLFLPACLIVALSLNLKALGDNFVPTEFAPLRATIDEAFANETRFQSQNFKKDELNANEKIADAAFYPSVSAGASSNWSSSQVYKDGQRANPGSNASLNSGINVSVSQNLYAGGKHVLQKEVSKLNTENGEIEAQTQNRTFLFYFTRELNQLVGLHRTLQQTSVELEQVKAMSVANVRKQKGGFLGAKESLETQNETQRASRMADLEQLQFNNSLLEFNSKFGLKNNVVSESAMKKISQNLKQICTAGQGFYAESDSKVKLAAQTFAVKQSKNAHIIAEFNVRESRIDRWSPQLNLSAGLELSKAHNAGFLGVTGIDTNTWTMIPSVSLKFSVSLWNAVSWAQFESAESRLKSASVATQSLLNQVHLAAEKNKLKMELYQLKRKSALDGLKMSNDLHVQNKRLFDAGELSVGQFIESQNNTFRIQKEIISLENEIQSNSCDALLQSQFGFMQSGDFAK